MAPADEKSTAEIMARLNDNLKLMGEDLVKRIKASFWHNHLPEFRTSILCDFCWLDSASDDIKLQGVVVFCINGKFWTLDLSSGAGTLTVGEPPEDTPSDLTLTIDDSNFASLVSGKLGAQQVLQLTSTDRIRDLPVYSSSQRTELQCAEKILIVPWKKTWEKQQRVYEL